MSWLGQGFSRESMQSMGDAYSQIDENRRAARAAGGYKDDGKKQPDPSKPGFTGTGNASIKDIMKMNKEIEKKNKMKNEDFAIEEYSLSVEDGLAIEEGKKKCKDGYEYDSDKKKCVKKDSKKTTIIMGRGYGYGHSHDDDDKDDGEDGGSNGGGGDAGGGDGGGGGGE